MYTHRYFLHEFFLDGTCTYVHMISSSVLGHCSNFMITFFSVSCICIFFVCVCVCVGGGVALSCVYFCCCCCCFLKKKCSHVCTLHCIDFPINHRQYHHGCRKEEEKKKNKPEIVFN